MELTLFVCRLRVACNEATIYSRMPRRAARDTGTDPMGGIDTRGYQGRMEVERMVVDQGKGVCSSARILNRG